jgi:uncharacterized damage-inducible protein DinB
MIGVRVVHDLYRYNRWANGREFEAASRLAPEDFVRDLGSSYPSVRDTLLHLVWGEWIWLQRWKGTSPREVFEPADFPRVETLQARWSDLEVEQRTFLGELTTDRLHAIVSYVNLAGQRWQYPLWREMYHVVNHSSYHRGQVTTLLRQLGARPVETDYLVFHDEPESSV